MSKSDHPCHDAHMAKLNRIAGQVEGIKKMINNKRYCPDILTQMRAVRSAIRSVELSILETHIQSCVSHAIKTGTQDEAANTIAELTTIIKRFD